MNSVARSCLMLVVVLVLKNESLAHSFWVNVPEHSVTVDPEAGTKHYFSIGYGEVFPAHEPYPKEDLMGISLLSPDGTSRGLACGNDGYLVGSYDIMADGVYILSAATQPAYWSSYLTEEGKEEWEKKSRDQLTGVSNVVSSEGYQMFAKAIVNVGPAVDDAQVQQKVGHALELIPLRNPATLKPGDGLQVRVELKGAIPDAETAKRIDVKADYLGFPSVEGEQERKGTVGADGIVMLTIDRIGVWRISASVEIPATEAEKSKIDKTYYGTVLTLGVPSPVTPE